MTFRNNNFMLICSIKNLQLKEAMLFNRIVPAFALIALLASMTGCGGGGAGATPGPAPVTPPPVSASGLVPEAGAVGLTLYTDAAPLRVLRDGAAWTYHGVDQANGAATAPADVKTYTTIVRHTAASGGMLENDDNPFNDDGSGPLRFEGGAYKYTQQIQLSANTPAETIDFIELRSPVRVNDQYVHLDRHVADSGTDFDGDKVNDAFDVAMYSRVVGTEVLDLPNRSQVKAVRVDATIRVRFTYSKTGATSPVFETVQSNWYAPGLGIVKTRMEEPNKTDLSLPNHVVTEVLQDWDGLTEGLGYGGTVAGVAPASSPLAGAALQYPLDAAGFDTHAVVATLIPGQPSAAGIALAQLDTRGNVVAARSYTRAELFPAATWFSEPHLLRTGSELRLLARTDNGGLSMVAFDSTGQRILRPAVIVMSDPQFGSDHDGTSYRVATDGTGIWLGWLRIISADNSIGLRSLVVRHFDASGQALGAERVVLDPVYVDISNFSMALDDTRLALSWRQSGIPGTRHLAMVDTGSGELVANKVLDSAYENACTQIFTLALQPGLAMVCWNNPVAPIGAARLDATGELVLSAGATLPTDNLKAPWLTRVFDRPVLNGTAGQLTVVAHQSAKYWPEDPLETGFTSVFQTSATSGALAANEPLLLARISALPGMPGVPALPTNVMSTVRLGNRLLLIGNDNAGYLNSAVVWLPN